VPTLTASTRAHGAHPPSTRRHHTLAILVSIGASLEIAEATVATKIFPYLV